PLAAQREQVVEEGTSLASDRSGALGDACGGLPRDVAHGGPGDDQCAGEADGEERDGGTDGADGRTNGCADAGTEVAGGVRQGVGALVEAGGAPDQVEQPEP